MVTGKTTVASTGGSLAKRLESLLADGRELMTLLGTSRAEFPGPGAPPWYPQFSNAVYTNIHQAAAGSETVAQAVNNIASQAKPVQARVNQIKAILLPWQKIERTTAESGLDAAN